ncbi:hypothetical protein HY745_03490 [Candidatus Desantisbacteria bacterium]|nr:hypothetical protein [Candidatus Desantisbacteria bacterium]
MIEAFFDRFYVEKEDFDLYTNIESDREFPFNNHPEIFLLSACIGYKYNLRIPLEDPKQLTLKTSVLNLENALTIYEAFKSIAFINNELDENGYVTVKTIMEEYAKGGFRKLYSEILSNSPKKGENLLNYVLLNLY